MTVTVSIAKALTIEECAAIRPLVQAHIEYEQSDVILPDDWAGRTAQLASAGKIIVLVARAEDQSVGYASFTSDVATWKGESFAYLDCLYVSDARRGAGIGRRLIDAAATEASTSGYRELQWQTPTWNIAAIRFYERLGATHQTKQRFTLPLPVS